MTMAGIGSAYGNVYESRYASSKKEVTEKQEAEQAAGKKYTNASEYYAYLKDKYPCLTAPNYKVTISPAYLEKCVKNPEEAVSFEKVLDHLPISHQNLITGWKAMGAEVKNEEWVFYEDGTGGMSPNMYVTNSNSLSGSSVQDKEIEKKAGRKSTPQNYYEKRKYLREQFEEKQARKAQIREQIEESALSRERNTNRVIERYEASVLKA